MTEINIPFEYSILPANEFIRDFNIAFAKGNVDFIIDHVSDDIVWMMHGDKKIEGKEAFSKEIHKMKDQVADELTLLSIISQGTQGAVNGKIIMDRKTIEFCDIYHFTTPTNILIKSIDSYIISI